MIIPATTSKTLAVGVLLTAFWACGQAAQEETPTAPVTHPGPTVRPDGPRLLLVLAIDQMAYQYVERFDPFLRGGLRSLLDNGVVFSDANYDHALTVTASGHVAMATGLHPSSSGIVNNTWLDRASGRPMYSFADPQYERSPVNLRGTGLADWIRGHDPGSKAFTVSQKDRSAIALGGHANQAAFWLDRATGTFTTSDYYPDRDPAWLAAFHSQRLPDRYFAAGWEPLPLSAGDVARLGLDERDEGLWPRRFPYSLGGDALQPDRSFYDDFVATPYSDAYVLTFAEEIIRAEGLGQRDHLDYLGIGLSALDLVGHSFGPRSREAADVVLRLDTELGRFFESLDATVGLDRVVVLLSADHGVAPVPEISAALGQPGRRAGYVDDTCFRAAGLRVGRELGLTDYVLGGLYLDYDVIAAAGLENAAVEQALARELEACAIVGRVWTRTEIQATRSDEPDHFRRLYRHSFDAERSADLFLQLVPFALPSGSSSFTTHGSPYPYDTHVPLVLLLPGVSGVEIAAPVSVVDAAPTLAALLGLSVPSETDGADLTALISEQVTLPDLTAYRGEAP